MSSIINKTELIKQIASDSKMPAAQVQKFFDCFTACLEQGISNKQEIRLHKLFTISIVDRKARMGTNPQTKQPLKIPARKSVVIKLSDSLKELVKQ